MAEALWWWWWSGGETGNLRARFPTFGDLHCGSDPAAMDLRGSRDQTASAGSLFNASECVAAERRQFVGKQTPGQGRIRLAPSLPLTRAARTPPRGALGQACRDRRDSASPLSPTQSWLPLPAGAPIGCDTAASAGPRAIHHLGFCPSGVRTFLAPHEAEAVHELRQNTGVGG